MAYEVYSSSTSWYSPTVSTIYYLHNDGCEIVFL